MDDRCAAPPRARFGQPPSQPGELLAAAGQQR